MTDLKVTEEVGDAAELDLARYIRPGALVAWGQGCAEPLTLTEALAGQRQRLGGVRCFSGISTTAAVRPEHCDHLSFSSYTAAGANRALSEAGLLGIVPCHYSQLPAILGRGPLRADVLLLALPQAGPDGTFGLGLAADYLAPLIGRAGTVIAEVNDQVPDVGGDRRLSRGEIDVLVRTSRPPAEYPGKPASDVDIAIAEHVAGLVPDGATLQVGIGSLPAVVLRHLRGHRDLGVHSGMITDEIAELIEAGVVTGARKATDRGLTVTGLLLGTSTLIKRAAVDKSIQLRDTRYTHDQAVLAAQQHPGRGQLGHRGRPDRAGQRRGRGGPLRRRHRRRRGFPARRGPVGGRRPGDRASLDRGAVRRPAVNHRHRQPHRGPAERPGRPVPG